MLRTALLAPIGTLSVACLVVAGCGRLSGPVGDECRVVSDCNLGQSCVDGRCVDEGGEGEGGEGEGGEGEGEGQSGCQTDGDCARGDACLGGVCTPVNGGGGCHDDSECAAGTTCISPDGPPQCGAPPPPPPASCGSNDECGAGEVCDFVHDFCGGGGDACIPACDDANPCASGETCNAGRCEAVSCTDGFTCPSWTVCGGVAPDPLSDDSHHGCIAITCKQDVDCPAPIGGFVPIAPAGFCVLGVCASGPGQCEPPVP